ncbi:hypothetical protein C8Q78DRAFT_1198967, partial [Trametes maxima]
MYLHCERNNLCEVWAYLWNSWYAPDRWKLWARSAYEQAIPRKRTTMVVEALWRNIKRFVLHMYNRPSIDLALYAIVTQALPPYQQKLAEILHDTRDGRAPTLSDTQASFKRAWEHLLKVPIKGEYTVDLTEWTCDCGTQKYHSHLLCKHLVQAAGPQADDWWPKVERYHVPPFYIIPMSGQAPPETMRSHAWLPRMRERPSIIRQRAQPRASSTTSESSQSPDIPDTPRTSRSSSCASIMSSPDKAPPTFDGILRESARGGAGFELDNAEEEDLNEVERRLNAAIAILLKQTENPDPRFVRSAIEKSFRGTIHWVCDAVCEEHPELSALTPEEACTYVTRAAELFRVERARGEPRFARQAKSRVRVLLDWVADVELTESRRTLPLTNVRVPGQPNPNRMVG